jgi:hypothetical protein
MYICLRQLYANMSQDGSNIEKMSDLEDYDPRYMIAVLAATGVLITLLVGGSVYRMVEFFLLVG